MRWINAFLLAFVFGMIAVIANAENATLTWDPNQEPDLAGYRVYWGNESRAYDNHVDVPAEPNEQKQVVVDIQPEDGRSIYFAATAYDGSGNESDYSNEVVWQVSDNVAPAIPGNFRLVVELAMTADGRIAFLSARVEEY